MRPATEPDSPFTSATSPAAGRARASSSTSCRKPGRPPGRRLAVMCMATLLWTFAYEEPGGSEDAFGASQMEFLEFSTAAPLRANSPLHVLNHLERASRDDSFSVADGAVPADAWDGIFEKLFRLRDTSDFDLLYLLNLLYAYEGHPAVPESLWQAADQAVLDFKYWYTDLYWRMWPGYI